MNLHLCPNALRVIGLQQFDISVIKTVFRAHRCHLNALYQTHVISLYGIEFIQEIIGIPMRSTITQGGGRMQICYRPPRFGRIIHALRLVDNNHRLRRLNKLNRVGDRTYDHFRG